MRNVFLAALFCALFSISTVASEDDLAAIYSTTGIKDCGYDTVNRGERVDAVLLRDEDRAKALASVERHFSGVEAVLFTHAPEGKGKQPGQPALIVLGREGKRYCVLGIGGSHSMEPFVSFEAKYGSQVRRSR